MLRHLHILNDLLLSTVECHSRPPGALSEYSADLLERQFPEYSQTEYFFIGFVHAVQKLMDLKGALFVRKPLCKIRLYIRLIFGQLLISIPGLPPAMCIVCISGNRKQPCPDILRAVKESIDRSAFTNVSCVISSAVSALADSARRYRNTSLK